MIRKHNRCRGVRLWKWNRFQVEVWFCPNDEWIRPHLHHNIHSRICLLLGRMVGNIDEVRGIVKRWRFYEVPAGVTHSATTDSFCVFINVERWIGEAQTLQRSAADDFTAI